jgi:hypothetical protein
MDKTKTTRKMLTRQQHITIIRELKNSPQGLTSLYFRFTCSIIDPPARVTELKRMGYEFNTSYSKELDHLGQAHERIARYTLISEPKQEAA